MTGTETLKLKSPLEATDFSFFAESANIQPAANGQQPKGILLQNHVLSIDLV